MKYTIESIFFDQYDNLISIPDVDSLREAIINLVNGSGIKPIDKRKIKLDVSSIQTLLKLQTYITNSMLKYQGMGTKKY